MSFNNKKLQSVISEDDPKDIYIYNVKILSIYCLIFTVCYFFYNITWLIVEGKTPFKKIFDLSLIFIFLALTTLLLTSFIGVKIFGA